MVRYRAGLLAPDNFCVVFFFFFRPTDPKSENAFHNKRKRKKMGWPYLARRGHLIIFIAKSLGNSLRPVYIFRAETCSKCCEDWTELTFSMDLRIKHFFPLCCLFVIPQNIQTRLISLVYHLIISCDFSCTSTAALSRRELTFCSVLGPSVGYFTSFL